MPPPPRPPTHHPKWPHLDPPPGDPPNPLALAHEGYMLCYQAWQLPPAPSVRPLPGSGMSDARVHIRLCLNDWM